MRSWAGEVQSFTRPLLMRRTAFQLFDLGDKNKGRKAHNFWSNEHVRIATEVHQAAQPLLLRNGNAGIQRARKARITAIRPPNAPLCNCTVDFDWQPGRSRGFCNRIKDLGFREGLRQHPKQPLTFEMP